MLRVYLAGEISLEGGGVLLRENDLPSRQVRHALAYLTLERQRVVPRDELAEALWPDGESPESRNVSLSAVVSKLRAQLERAGLSRGDSVSSAFGCYQLRLPGDAWVDLEVALANLHEAEGALLLGDPRRGYVPALVASTILRRPFLPGLDAPWAQRRRATLKAALLRALDAMIRCLESNGELALAVKNAEEAVELDPLREEGYRHLMRLHLGAGNRAAALEAFHRCRTHLVEELGVGPSEKTEALYEDALGSG